MSQILSDDTYTYLYGNGRIAQYTDMGLEYFLTDGLGSVRQLADGSGAISLAKSYQPYGEELSHTGSEYSSYGFAGEITDPTGLIYLRARYYAPSQGRFLTRDAWQGEYTRPLSLNGWMYVEGNPVNRVDPSGRCYGPLSFLRNIPIESGICEHLDQAMFIYAWPGSTSSQRNLAAAYIGGWTFSHSALIVGAGGLSVAGGKAAILWLYGLYAANPVLQQAGQKCQNVSVWLSKPFQRGVEIENQIGRSPELVQIFPVIDRFENGVVTSIKSIDLGARTYQNLTTLTRTVQSYVTKVANWSGATWGGASIEETTITGREIILAIPPSASQAQLQTLSQLQVWAQNLGVTLKIVTIP